MRVTVQDAKKNLRFHMWLMSMVTDDWLNDSDLRPWWINRGLVELQVKQSLQGHDTQ